MNKEEFLNLPIEDIRQLVLREDKPQTGVFITDGNRRLVMTQTGLTPGSKDFYPTYLKIITESFMRNLTTFFTHGLNTLLFPLFGASLLERDKTFKQDVMPELVRLLFQDEKWGSFYREYGIRVKTYGDMEPLHREFPGMDLEEKMKEREIATSGYTRHTLFYGFFSRGIFESSLEKKLNGFIETNHRGPSGKEWLELYYGEFVDTADFFITSTRLAGLGALPPFIYGKKTRMYTLVAPGVFALNEKTYREILYDLLYGKSYHSKQYLNETSRKDIERLGDFYQQQRDRVIGTGKIVGRSRVLNV